MEKSKFRQTGAHQLEFYEDIRHIPIDNGQRRCTDILCTIVGLTLTIVLAIFAIVVFNRPQYYKEVFPTDTDGFTCGYELPGYNVIYFANPTEMKNRVCVSSCPASQSEGLACKKTSTLGCEFGSNLQYYQSTYVHNNYGEFCMPTDPGQRKTLESQLQNYKRELYYSSVKTIERSLVVAAIVSFLYMFLVQCCPRIMNKAVVVIGTLALIILAITIIVYPSQMTSTFRWAVFALTLLFIVVLVCVFVKHFKYWGLNGVFLEFGSKFVCARIYPFLLPIVFLALGTAFYFFEIYQYRSFWSFGALKFDPEVNLYHTIANPTNNIILSIFQLIQIIWGTFFLKQAFAYIISAEASEWYFGNVCKCSNGVFTLVCKHLGSVIACAFMNGFFGLGDFIFDALIPPLDDANGCFSCINRFTGFFDLARSDALTIVYVSGNSYCNAARYSEYLFNKNPMTSDAQTTGRVYRYTSHFAIAAVVTILAFWILNLKLQVSFSGMGVLLLMSLGVSTFFISLHADASQAILLLYLMEQQFTQTRRASSPGSKYGQIDDEVKKFLQGI